MAEAHVEMCESCHEFCDVALRPGGPLCIGDAVGDVRLEKGGE